MAMINVKDEGKYLLMELEGDFVGGEETDKLREELKALAQSENNKLVIDLTHVVYFASPTLGVLLSANAQFSKNKGKIALYNPSEYIENIFEITKLTIIFPICYSMDEALKAIKAQ